jgi:hypothetical protein
MKSIRAVLMATLLFARCEAFAVSLLFCKIHAKAVALYSFGAPYPVLSARTFCTPRLHLNKKNGGFPVQRRSIISDDTFVDGLASQLKGDRGLQRTLFCRYPRLSPGLDLGCG